MVWRLAAATALAGSSVGCGGPTIHPPEPAPDHPAGSVVAAPVDTTWKVTLEMISTRRLPTARIDSSARLIVTSPIMVHPIDADKWATCGHVTDPRTGRIQFLADRAEFSILVRPLGDSSIVMVAAIWMTGAHGGGECESRHVWEPGLERAVKTTAERRYTFVRLPPEIDR